MRFIADRLRSACKIRIGECRIRRLSSPWPEEEFCSFGEFENATDFASQRAIFKFAKYVRSLLFFLWYAYSRSPLIVYLIDYQLAGMIAALTSCLGLGNVRIVYHQFETIEPDKLQGRLNNCFWSVFRWYSKRLSLIVVPERNRLNYLLELISFDRERTILFPNTCSANYELNPPVHDALRGIPDNAILIGHVGNIGPNHYLETFLQCIDALKDNSNVYFVVVGNFAAVARKAFEEVENPRMILLDAIPHSELPSVYVRIDLGLILYKGIDRNFEFCAPNKLYEYWSHGIPVVAHPLRGLQSVFMDNRQGMLVNLESPGDLEKLVRSAERLTEASKMSLLQFFDSKLSIERCLKELESKLGLGPVN